MSIFLTKLGTFGKMAPNFVILGNYNNDHATNLKICTYSRVSYLYVRSGENA